MFNYFFEKMKRTLCIGNFSTTVRPKWIFSTDITTLGH